MRQQKEIISSPTTNSIMNEIIAVALCGGLGTRMRSITQDRIPKSLIELEGKPLIDYSIDILLEAGVLNFLFVAGHLADGIEHYVDNKFAESDTVITAKVPQEVNGLVRQTQYALQEFKFPSGPLVLFDCDAVRIGLDFRKAYHFHKQKKSDVTFVGVRSSHPKNSNFAVIHDENNEVLAIGLQPEGVLHDIVIKCGMMICSEDAAKILREDTTINDSWIAIIEALSVLNNTFVYVAEEMQLYANINTPEELHETKGQLKKIRK